MLTKLLFTAIVIAVVYFVYRGRAPSPPPARQPAKEPETDHASISHRTLAYILIALLVAISGLIFLINWNEQNRIVNIRVTGADGGTVTYQARRKSIAGREFVTLDGRSVALGDSDRIEMIEE